jgi:HAD superfamily hydrolase (TIGR01549 family)
LLRDRTIYPTPEAFWTNYARLQLEALGCTAEQARSLAPEMSAYMNDRYHPQDELAPGTLTVLEQLRAAGFVLGVVSNREAPFADYLTALGLGGYVTFSLSGGEAGSKKPDKGIFEHALRLAGSCAAETIYVGDNYFADVIGARGAGIIPVLFDPEGLFEEPDCAVIRAHDGLPALLDGRNAWPGNGK